MENNKERNYVVYKHTTPSGKCYVGITGQNPPEKRWRNGYGYKSNEYFVRAIKKYSWDNIKHEIIISGLTKEEAEQKEIELIAYYKSDNRNYGYNIEHGGNAVGKMAEETRQKIIQNMPDLSGENHPLYGKHLSEETKRKISESHKGKTASEETRRKLSEIHKNISDETRRKMSESRKGEKNHNYGKKMPFETRMKLSEAHKGKKLSKEHVEKIRENSKKQYTEELKNKLININSIEISQYDKEGNFIRNWKSEAEANRGTGIYGINACCRDQRKKAGGFIWRYADQELTEEHLAWCNDNKKYGKMVSVCQYDLDGNLIKIYRSQIDAEKETNISNSAINNCCHRIIKTAGKFIWRYEDDLLTDEDLKWCNETGYEKHQKAVIQYDLLGNFIKVYPSATIAKKEAGIDNSDIGKCCKGKQQSAKGFIWRYASEIEDPTSPLFPTTPTLPQAI